MPNVDTESLLTPCSACPPCGEDLEYDPAFLELFRLAHESGAERMVGADEAPPTDWRSVFANAQELFERTKDIRVAVLFCRASLALHGIPGLATSLGVLSALLEHSWQTVHPVLSAEEELNPLMRVNALHELRAREMLLEIQAAPLVKAAGLGSLSYKEIVASQEQGGDEAAVMAVFRGCELAELQAACAALSQAKNHVADVERVFNAAVEPAYGGIDLQPLLQLLSRLERCLLPRLEERQDGLSEEEGQEAPDMLSVDDNGTGEGTRRRKRPSGEVSSRDDVIAALDALCAYYQRAEPASPVPMLLRRARRLVPMTFEEVLGDLAPSAMNEVKVIRGSQEA